MEKDKLPGNLWLAKWNGSENRALTFGNKGAAHPRWSPDGKWIAFLSDREAENEIDQLWILPIGGGEAEKLTDLKGSVDDFAWAPDSKRIVLVVHDPDPREPEKKGKEKKTLPPIVIDRFQFKQDIDGYLTDRYSHLQIRADDSQTRTAHLWKARRSVAGVVARRKGARLCYKAWR